MAALSFKLSSLPQGSAQALPPLPDPSLGQFNPTSRAPKKLGPQGIDRHHPCSDEAMRAFCPSAPETTEVPGGETLTLDGLILSLLSLRKDYDGETPVIALKEGKPLLLSKTKIGGNVIFLQ